jgi:hypothetical protein
MSNINNLSALFYTSENHVPIAKLSIDEFNKFSQNIDVKKYLVSNNIKHNLEFSDSNLLGSSLKEFASPAVIAIKDAIRAAPSRSRARGLLPDC